MRILPGPIERIWEYLTAPKKRVHWFCAGATQQKTGGKVVFAAAGPSVERAVTMTRAPL